MCTRIVGCQSRRYYVGSYTAHCLIHAVYDDHYCAGKLRISWPGYRYADLFQIQYTQPYYYDAIFLFYNERERVSLPSCRLVPTP